MKPFKEELTKASNLFKAVAGLAEDSRLKKYLTLKAEVLLTSEYNASDIAWMNMKNNGIAVDIVIVF